MGLLVTTLPNGDLLGDRAIAAFAVVQEALIIFIKARIDHEGRPRAATVKANIGRVEEALTEMCAAIDVLDLRSLELLREAAGAKRLEVGDFNRVPLNESPIFADAFSRGHNRR